MSQNLTLAQLESADLKEIKGYKASAASRKKELEAIKSKGGAAWTPELQEELDEIAIFLVDVDELIEKKADEEKNAKKSPAVSTKKAYTPAPGTEKLIHVKIVNRKRFDPNTGKELSKPYRQLFTFGEWQNFSKHHSSLGFRVVEVLHDPYGVANKIVEK